MPVIDFKEEKVKEIKPKTYTWAGWLTFFLSLIIVGGALGTVLFLKQVYARNLQTVQDEITNLETEKSAKQKEVAVAVEVSKKITSLNKALSNHLCFTNIFDEIEKTTVKKVYFDNLSLESQEGSLSLSAKAATYLDAANQLAVWRSKPDFFTKVLAPGFELEEGLEGEKSYVDFKPQIKLNLEKFKCQVK